MATARVSNARGGRVPRLSLMTPPEHRHKKIHIKKRIRKGGHVFDVSGTVDHSIARRKNSRKTADQYNSAVTCFDKPCLKRWLEFTEQKVPRRLKYEYYPPPPINPKPDRVWTLVNDEGPVATFTNMVEGHLIRLGFETFGDGYDYKLIYTDFTC